MGRSKIQSNDLVSQISHKVNKKFWKIFSRHVKVTSDDKWKEVKLKPFNLYLESLRQVEGEYDSYLTRGSESINFYLSSNYLEKLDKM